MAAVAVAAPARQLDALRAVPRAAWRDAAIALLVSRVIVWGAGLVGLGAFGTDPRARGFDPAGLTTPFGAVGDTLIGPAARWDAAWYLLVAEHGYQDGARAAFFPLYPLLVRVCGTLLGSPALGALAVSLAAAYGALVVLHRLAALELGERAARTAVQLCAFFPSALFLSAIYSESLFLLLSAGTFLAARHDRWWLAGLLGGLAAATRSVGLLLIVPLVVLYAVGPRERSSPSATARPRRAWAAALIPRYPLRRDFAALALVPCGLGAYLGYLAATGVDANAPFAAQEVWGRAFAGPYLGVIDGLHASFDGLRQLLSGARTPVYYTAAGGDPFEVARRNLIDLAFLGLVIGGVIGVLRTLPLAYGLWCAAALALPLSYPVAAEPLMSMPRFALVLFPLPLWLAGRLAQRPVARERVLALSAGGLAALSILFTSWRWVA